MKLATAFLALCIGNIPATAASDAALSAALVERIRTEAPPERPAVKPSVMWKTSVAVLAAAAAADVLSSWNKRELNPMLAGPGGRFGARGLAVKALITGGAIGGQLLLVRRNPEASKAAAAANFGMSGVFAVAAAHNMGNKAAPATLGK